MSNHIEQSDYGTDGTAGKSMHPYQSAWMAHWTSTSCKLGTQADPHLSLNYEFKQDAGDTKKHRLLGPPEMATSDSIFSKGFREVSEARRVDIMNKTMKPSPKSKPFNMFKVSQHREKTMALNNDQATTSRGELLKSQIDLNYGCNSVSLSESELPSRPGQAHPEMETSSRECHFKPRDSEKQLKSHNFLDKSSLGNSTYFQDDMGLSSKIVPYGFNSERAPMQSFVSRQEEGNRSTPISASKEHFPNTKSYSTCFIHEKGIDNKLDSTRSRTSLLSWNDAPLLLDDPLASGTKLPFFGGKQYEKMQIYSGSRLFPAQSIPPEVTKSEKSYPKCYSVPRMPCPVNDAETMRICTAIDSIQETSGEPPKFSQRTHHFLITNKTDVNLSGGGQLFRESTVSTKLKGKMFSEFLHLSSDFHVHDQQGVKLQPIGSSAGSEEKENVGNVKTSAVCIKNESSAETDTMDMGVFQKNHLLGVASSSSNKNIRVGQSSSTSQTAGASAREDVGGGLLNDELPDINQEPPAVRERASSIDDKETSSSRTQSLDVEHFLSNAEQPRNSKSGACRGGPLEPDPSSRWVKRLRMSASDSFGYGIKSSQIGEASSHENKTSSKSVKCRKINSEPSNAKYHGKAPMALDQIATVLKNSDVSSSGLTGKSQDIMLLRSWIRRWCHNNAASQQQKPEAMVVCEPQDSKRALDKFQKKQFPSIAAMALMGKAMNGFSPCELRKRGSLIVWK